MRQKLDDIVLVEGDNELNVQLVPIPVAEAEFYMSAEMRKSMYPTIEPYTVCEVWCDITNKGDASGTRNVHILDSVGNVDFTMEVTLQPGETYTWHRAQWIDFSRISRYWVKAQGDWIGNNYSEAIFP